MDIMSVFEGRELAIQEFMILRDNGMLNLTIKGYINGLAVTMRFFNVSRLSLENISFPAEVQGFVIISNDNNGWDRDSRYSIRDYENGSISFMCEAFEIDDE